MIFESLHDSAQRGEEMLTRLLAQQAAAITAKCPADLEANMWYQRRGFVLAATETTRSGRVLNVWRLARANDTE